MSAFSERVEREDENDRLRTMAAALHARAAWAAQAQQMSLDMTDESYTGTCQKCGAYWDTRQFTRCPARYLRHLPPCDGYIG